MIAALLRISGVTTCRLTRAREDAGAVLLAAASPADAERTEDEPLGTDVSFLAAALVEDATTEAYRVRSPVTSAPA